MNYRVRLTKISLLSSFFFLFFLSALLYAQDFSSAYSTTGRLSGGIGLPKTSEARKRIRDVIFLPIGKLSGVRDRIVYQKSYGSMVKFEVWREKDYLYLLFLNRDPFSRSFKILERGNYIIKRSLRDGSFIQAKVFLRKEKGSFIRLFPDGDRTRMNLTLLGYNLYNDVVLPIPFDKLLTEDFSTIERCSSMIVDWNFVLYRGLKGEDSRVSRVAERIAECLPKLGDADDGAMNEKGEFVYIRNGEPQKGQRGFNCSGFAKWVIDGFYYPITGHLLPIDILKKRDLRYRGNRWSKRYEKERDPYFGLDWSRNLACALLSARQKINVRDPEVVDVRDSKYIPYIEDVGYPVKDLKFLLFYLAYKYPGYFYIGAVNANSPDTLALRQYFHIILFFPYFDSEGKFRVRVMERERETSVESVKRRYPQDYIHLVKVEAIGKFQPILFGE